MGLGPDKNGVLAGWFRIGLKILGIIARDDKGYEHVQRYAQLQKLLESGLTVAEEIQGGDVYGKLEESGN